MKTSRQPSNYLELTAPDLPLLVELGLHGIDRWTIFHRLRELSIPCDCGYGQPLRVQIETPMSAIQLWSVIRRVTTDQPALVAHLERCWQAVRVTL